MTGKVLLTVVVANPLNEAFYFTVLERGKADDIRIAGAQVVQMKTGPLAFELFGFTPRLSKLCNEYQPCQNNKLSQNTCFMAKIGRVISFF